MPQLIARLARHTVFLRLADVAPDLPPYEEHVTSVAMLPAQQRAYDRLKGDLLAALKEALVKGSKRLLGAYLQSILAYPDAPYREEVVVDPKDDHVVARAPALDEDMESETGREPATTGARTMTLFDYMAARPAAGASKGGKARTSPPSAQLLLFDLFAEQPGAAGAAAVPATPIQQRGIFADTAGAAEREEVA